LGVTFCSWPDKPNSGSCLTRNQQSLRSKLNVIGY
jgi:hypothetical protein